MIFLVNGVHKIPALLKTDETRRDRNASGRTMTKETEEPVMELRELSSLVESMFPFTVPDYTHTHTHTHSIYQSANCKVRIDAGHSRRPNVV